MSPTTCWAEEWTAWSSIIRGFTSVATIVWILTAHAPWEMPPVHNMHQSAWKSPTKQEASGWRSWCCLRNSSSAEGAVHPPQHHTDGVSTVSNLQLGHDSAPWHQSGPSGTPCAAWHGSKTSSLATTMMFCPWSTSEKSMVIFKAMANGAKQPNDRWIRPYQLYQLGAVGPPRLISNHQPAGHGLNGVIAAWNINISKARWKWIDIVNVYITYYIYNLYTNTNI